MAKKYASCMSLALNKQYNGKNVIRKKKIYLQRNGLKTAGENPRSVFSPSDRRDCAVDVRLYNKSFNFVFVSSNIVFFFIIYDDELG